MTDNEIIKALECCSTGETYDDCEKNGCPLYLGITMGCKYIDKENQLYSDALDLINRKQAENEELRIENQSLRAAANSYKMHYNEAKSEAIKEFAERLKSSIYINTNLLVYQCEAVESVIDDIVKEMVGDTDD